MNPKSSSCYLKTKDYLCSNEEFELLYNSKKDLLKTYPFPPEEDMHIYYTSNEYISHSDSESSFFEKIYQKIKRVNIKSKFKWATKYHKKPGNILDFGCGTGDFLAYAKSKQWIVTGVEPNQRAREKAIHKGVLTYPELNDTFTGFDLITLWHVLEHIHAPNELLQKLNKLINQNGIICVAVPNFNSWDAKHYKSFWAAYDVPRHLWHFSKTAIERIFDANGYQLIRYRALYFDSYYVSLLSEQYKHGKKNWLRAFVKGTISNLKGIISGEYSSHIYMFAKK